MIKKLFDKFRQTQVGKSIFRRSYTGTPRDRMQATHGNVFFHIHPVNIRRGALELGFTVPFGLFLRNIHRWAAHLMVITAMVHMFRVFMTGSYKHPREFNWVIGVILLTLTLLLSFTGYLLPWDQLGYWAITVGTNMARASPFVGHEGPFGPQLGMTAYNDLRFAMLGGSTVGSNALLRAYIWHCIALPIAAYVLLLIRAYFSRHFSLLMLCSFVWKNLMDENLIIRRLRRYASEQSNVFKQERAQK